MLLLLIFCMAPALSIFVCVGYAYVQTVRRHRPLRVGRLAVVAALLQAALTPTFALIAGATYRAVHPNDDWYDIVGGGVGVVNGVAVPLVAIVVTVAGHVLERQRVRRSSGYCSGCGYDLRGSPGPRCPECGTRFDGSEVETGTRASE